MTQQSESPMYFPPALHNELAKRLGDWRDMKDAPRDCTEVRLLLAGKDEVVGHFAQDLSGGEQPPFSGWFVPMKDAEGRVLYNAEVEPIGWQPLHSHQ